MTRHTSTKRRKGRIFEPPPYLRFNIHWSCPDEVKSCVEPVLKANAVLVPTWCHNIAVAFEGDSDDGDARLSIIGRPEYREARITVHGSWLALGKDDRSESLHHELLHLPTEPLHQFVTDVLAKFPEDEKARLKRLWIRLLEGTTQDLTHMVMALKQKHRKAL